MSVAFTTARPRIRARHLAWLPAVVLLGWGVLAAAGVPLAPSTNAATSSVNVSATVPLDIHIGGTCPGQSYTDANLAVGDVAIGACTVTFGTNNGAVGSVLKVEHARPAGNAFCQEAVTVDCGTKPSFADATGTATLAVGAFGVKVAAAPTCSTPSWTNGNYYGLRDATTATGAGDTVCTHAGNTDGSYSLEFRANRDTGTVAGTYNARADFTVEAS